MFYYCLNLFRNDPKKLGCLPITARRPTIHHLSQIQKKNIPRVEIWFTFGYGSHRLEKFPIGRAKHPGDSSRPLMKSFSTRTTISRDSRKQHLWITRKAICPSCSQRDVKSNRFVVSEYLGILPDPVGLASRCNGGIGTATSSGTSPPH